MLAKKGRVELVVVFPPVRSQVDCSQEDGGEEDPEPGLSCLANLVGEVGKSDGAVLVGGALSHVGEGVDQGFSAHAGAREVLLNSSHSVKGEVGDVGGVGQHLVLEIQVQSLLDSWALLELVDGGDIFIEDHAGGGEVVSEDGLGLGVQRVGVVGL